MGGGGLMSGWLVCFCPEFDLPGSNCFPVIATVLREEGCCHCFPNLRPLGWAAFFLSEI
jgi:hypothetical protein